MLISTNGTEPKAYGVEYLKGEAIPAAFGVAHTDAQLALRRPPPPSLL